MKSAAIIGCGRKTGAKEGHAIGHAHARCWLEAFPELELCGVDPDPVNLAAFGETFGIPGDRLFASTQALYGARVPEAVSVCTWPALHSPLVIEAALRGVKGIVCEKPMALDGSEIEEMMEICGRQGARLAIAHQRRFEPLFTTARAVVASGALGENQILEARVSQGWDMLSWTVHWFDMANYLFDAEPVSVLAGLDHTGGRRYHQAIENDSVVFAVYPGPGRRQAIFITGPDAPLGQGIRICGDKGTLTMTGEGVVVTGEGGRTVHPAKAEFSSGFVALFRDLDASIRNGTPMRCGADRCAVATRMAYAAHESARTCRKIDPAAAPKFPPLEVAQHPCVSRETPPDFGKAVLLADAHHADPVTGEGGREGLIDALSAIGISDLRVVKVNEEPLAADHLDGANILLIYHTLRQSDEVTKALLRGWVESGRPLVVVHCGIGAYDWPEYRQWIGRYWIWRTKGDPVRSRHDHVPSPLRVVDPSFATQWAEAWLPRDEVYSELGEAGPVRDLVVAELADRTVPVAWQSVEHPQIVTWCPGHRRDLWGLPAMREGLKATIQTAMSTVRPDSTVSGG